MRNRRVSKFPKVTQMITDNHSRSHWHRGAAALKGSGQYRRPAWRGYRAVTSVTLLPSRERKGHQAKIDQILLFLILPQCDCVSECTCACVTGMRRLRDGVTPSMHLQSLHIHCRWRLCLQTCTGDQSRRIKFASSLTASSGYHSISSPNQLQIDLFYTLGVQVRSCWGTKSSTALLKF